MRRSYKKSDRCHDTTRSSIFLSPYSLSNRPRTRSARSSLVSISEINARTTAIPVAPACAASTRRKRCCERGTSTDRRTSFSPSLKDLSRPPRRSRSSCPASPPDSRKRTSSDPVLLSGSSSARLMGLGVATARAILARASFAEGRLLLLVSVTSANLLRLGLQELRRHVLVLREVLQGRPEGLRVEREMRHLALQDRQPHLLHDLPRVPALPAYAPRPGDEHVVGEVLVEVLRVRQEVEGRPEAGDIHDARRDRHERHSRGPKGAPRYRDLPRRGVYDHVSVVSGHLDQLLVYVLGR